MGEGCVAVRLPEAGLLDVLAECEGHINSPCRGSGSFFYHPFQMLVLRPLNRYLFSGRNTS